MKVCIICPSFPPKVCGIGDYTYKLARELTKSDIEVVIISNEDSGIKEKFSQIKNPRVLSAIKDWGFKNLSKVLKILKAEKPDIIHIQYQNNLYQSKQMINFLPLFLRFFIKSKIIITLHELQHPRFLPFTNLFSKLNIFTSLFFSHKIIVTSEMQYARIPGFCGLKFKSKIIPVGSNIDIFPITEEQKSNFRQRMNIFDDEILIVNFGMIRQDKGLEILFRALKGMILEGYKAKLVLAGARPKDSWNEYREEIFSLAEGLGINKHVLELGFLSEKDASFLLSSADMSILPYAEGASTKRGPLAACFSHNLPIITTRNKLLPTFLEDNENIILVKPNEPEELKDKAIGLITNKILKERIKRNMGRVANYLSWHNISKLHIEIYNELSKRKILIIAVGFLPGFGGAEKQAFQMCKNFKAYKPVVLTSREPESADFDRRQDFKIYRFLYSKKGLFRLLLFSCYSLLIAIKERPSIVFCSNIHHDSFCAFVIKKLFNIPFMAYVYDMHDLLPLLNKKRISHWMLKMHIKNADRLFAISNFTKSLIEKFLDSNKITVLNPGVDTQIFNPQVNPSRIIDKYNLKDKFIILSVSRLVEHKGIDKALEAVYILKKEFNNLVYLIVGSGEDLPRLERLVEDYGLGDSVFFSGSIKDDEELAQYYAASDIFILPSRKTKDGLIFEGFGISFMEAAACGKPSIGGRIGGVNEAIIDGQTGMLIDPLNADEIGKAITLLLKQKALRQRMGDMARIRAVGDFSWDRFSRKIEDIITEGD